MFLHQKQMEIVVDNHHTSAVQRAFYDLPRNLQDIIKKKESLGKIPLKIQSLHYVMVQFSDGTEKTFLAQTGQQGWYEPNG